MQNNIDNQNDKWELFKLFLCFIGFLVLCFLFINELFERINFINLFMKLLGFLASFRLLASGNIIAILLGMMIGFGAYHMPW